MENTTNNFNVDDIESPNVYPYKKCISCGDRKSCGNYNDEYVWFCEDCYVINNFECDNCDIKKN